METYSFTRREIVDAFARELEEIEDAIEGSAQYRNERWDAISNTRWSFNRYIHQRYGIMDVALRLGLVEEIEERLYQRAHEGEEEE